MANNINPSVPKENPVDMSEQYSDERLNIGDRCNRINDKLNNMVVLYATGNNNNPKPKPPKKGKSGSDIVNGLGRFFVKKVWGRWLGPACNSIADALFPPEHTCSPVQVITPSYQGFVCSICRRPMQIQA